jgi:hypothetical protein
MAQRESKTLWAFVVILVIVNFAGILATLKWLRLPTGDPSAPFWSVYLEPQGSLYVELLRPDGRTSGRSHSWPAPVIRPFLTSSLLLAAFGLGLVAFVSSTRRRRSAEGSLRPRLTMSRGMVVIAAVSVWLWVSRADLFWIFCGSLVLLLALVADSRRRRLVQELKTNGEQASAWLRLSIAGYWIVAILALSWVACLLVTDSFRPGNW